MISMDVVSESLLLKTCRLGKQPLQIDTILNQKGPVFADPVAVRQLPAGVARLLQEGRGRQRARAGEAEGGTRTRARSPEPRREARGGAEPLAGRRKGPGGEDESASEGGLPTLGALGTCLQGLFVKAVTTCKGRARLDGCSKEGLALKVFYRPKM